MSLEYRIGKLLEQYEARLEEVDYFLTEARSELAHDEDNCELAARVEVEETAFLIYENIISDLRKALKSEEGKA